MNYRHAYHAGNFADVHKHIALTAILTHLTWKRAPFAVIDTHAGRGLYDLRSAEAQVTAEAADGIARLQGHIARTPFLRKYLELVRGVDQHHYPGSPLLAAKLLRQADRLVLMEKHSDEFHALRQAVSGFSNVDAVNGDGYRLLARRLPPAERRGLVLLDPSYEQRDELATLARVIAEGYRRFATGIFLVWYPLKLSAPIDALVGEILAVGVTNLLKLTLDVDLAKAGDDRLSAAGLLVVNPPYEFDPRMRDTQCEILPLLRQGSNASASVEWIARSS